MDLLLDDNHDLVFVNGSTQVTLDRVDVVAQRLKIRLLTFLGEWRFNTAYGVPYFQRIYGFKIRKTDIDTIFQQIILQEPGVRSIVSFESTFESRVYNLVFRVRIDTGEVTDGIQISPGV